MRKCSAPFLGSYRDQYLRYSECAMVTTWQQIIVTVFCHKNGPWAMNCDLGKSGGGHLCEILDIGVG